MSYTVSDVPPPQHAHANNHAKQLLDISHTHEHRENAMDAMFASAKNVDDDDHQKMKHATTSKEEEEVADDEWVSYTFTSIVITLILLYCRMTRIASRLEIT